MADRGKAFDLQTSPCDHSDRPSGSHQSREHRSSYDETDLGTHEFNKYGEINHPRQQRSSASLAGQPALRTTDTLFIRGTIFTTAYTLGSCIYIVSGSLKPGPT